MKSISKCTIKVLQLLTVFVMLAGAVFPPTVVAHAQDVVPPAPEQTAEPPADESPAEAAPEAVVPPEQTVEAPAADPAEVVPPEQTVEAPAVDPTEIIPAEQTVEAPVEVLPTVPVLPLEQTVEAPTEVVPVTGGAAEDGAEDEAPAEDLAEIVQVLEETNTVLVNENDEVIPLASEEAAEVLEGADPFFYDPVLGRYVGYTSSSSKNCPSDFVASADCHNNVAEPIKAALDNPNMPEGATLYIEGTNDSSGGGKYYSDSVTIDKSITLQAGRNFRKDHGNFTFSTGYATINSVTLTANLNAINNVFANNVIVNAGGDALINGNMLDDALTLIRPNGTVTLSEGTFQDEDNGFTIDDDGVTLQGHGDSTIINGDNKTNGNGIFLNNVDHVTVRKLKVIDSYDGIEIKSGGGNSITNVTLKDNTNTGLYIRRDWPYEGWPSYDEANSISYSNIFKNGNYGIYSEVYTGGMFKWLIASHNYWDGGLKTCTESGCSGSGQTKVYDIGGYFNISIDNPETSMVCADGQTAVGGACVDIVRGCTNSAYLEYNASANVDDGSCHTLKVVGCMDSNYLEYNAAANVSTPSMCLTLKTYGCKDSAYVEYDAAANTSDASLCKTLKTYGCKDPAYLEYNSSANTSDPTLCVTPRVVGCMDSSYVEYNSAANVSNASMCVTPKSYGCWNSNYVEYNPSTTNEDNSLCVTPKVVGCMDSRYVEFNPSANTSDSSMCVTPKVVGCMNSSYIEFNPAANTSDPSMCVTPKVVGCLNSSYVEYNPAANTGDDSMCVTPKTYGCWDSAYVEYNPSTTNQDNSLCVTPKVVGCMDSSYVEFNPAANTSDASLCVTPKVIGCMDGSYMEYNAAANVNDPAQCVTPKVYGCMDSDYVEYDPAANSDDGTCATLKVFGCTDSDYVEYNAAANTDNGTCATLKVYGCTDSDYVEYNPAANTDNGTCSTLKVFGCTNSEYMEYDAAANTDDGTCVTPKVYGCMNDDYLEYNPEANSDNGTCTTLKVYGCMDNTYVEYNSKANVDDGSCEVKKVYGCTDEDYMEYNSKANTDDGSCEVLKVFGCTDPGRDGYDPEANVDDGESCGRKLSCPAGFYDGDANGTCDHTDCKPGFNDLNSDGKCVATVCAPGTNDDDADGYCEDDDVVENPGGPNGGPFGTYNVAGGNGVIPVTGGMNQLSCTDANTLVLANGNSVGFSAPMCGYSAGLNEDNAGALPAPLPTGYGFASGMTLNVTKGNDPATVLPDPVTDTLTFVVPDELKDKTFTILYWDAAANGGLGKWIEIPAKIMKDGKVVSAPLAAGDEREVVSGVEITALLTGEATLNFTGTFVLAYK